MTETTTEGFKVAVVQPPKAAAHEGDLKYYTASQFQLMWWKFRKHRLALIGTAILGVFLIISLFAEFLAPYTPTSRSPDYLYGAPQVLHFIDSKGSFHFR